MRYSTKNYIGAVKVKEEKKIPIDDKEEITLYKKEEVPRLTKSEAFKKER